MHRMTLRGLVIALLAIAPAAAFAADPVTVTLQAQRVTMANGKEVLAPAAEARPGEVLEYRATYRNTGTAPASNLRATLPVPAGLEYLPRTAVPARVEASLDGRTWAAVPLTRTVRRADGRTVTETVPAAEYRYLRWAIGTLNARASRLVTARMRVQALPVAASNR